MRDDIVENYLKAMKDTIFRTWKTDSVSKRVENMQLVIADRTKAGKLPRLTVDADSDYLPSRKLTNANGQFEPDRWRMVIRADLVERNSVSKENAMAFPGTLFHETRHSEQRFNVLRYVEPNGWRFPGVNAPKHAVNLARPPNSDSAARIQAKYMELDGHGALK
ncbi:hypothetical protein INH39_28895 [Massilia violaceinigra]|uniref:Uncharacterized protein n=1 Tax=Massilia violaceinigra TaxID=2045208 RepID=A0ABY4A5U5_9BURK|nr:hypothetical protein [Massilia violaceinigra]UOD29379.1 hypothetical protein INH39_28895 [Massilia violaceinigra]